MNALFRPLLRQSLASSGIYLLIIALSLAISATTALKFSNGQVQHAVALQAAKMQAADLVLTDQHPIDPIWKAEARRHGLQQSEVTVFSSMAHTADHFVMVNVKAIDSQFPLRGELRVAPQHQQIQSGEIWLSQRAMELLKLKLGQHVQIADATFKFSAVIEHDANQELGFSAFSPTVIIAQQDIARTHAIQTGSRIDYRLLLAGEAAQLKQFEQAFRKQHPKIKDQSSEAEVETNVTQSTIKFRKAEDGNTRLMKPIQNLDTFLQLANILTILLCGIAIALSSQRFVQQNQDYIALMRCIGTSKTQILSVFLSLMLMVMMVATLLGTVLGLVLGYGLLQLMLQLIPNLELTFNLWQLVIGPLPIAIFTSAVVLLGFVLPSLLQLISTAPIRVIRQQGPSFRAMWVVFASGLCSLAVFAVVLSANMKLSLMVMMAILILSLLLYGLIWMSLKVIKALKLRWSTLIRAPAYMAVQITALALGLSLITVLTVLRADLLERWQQQLPEGTPNQFVYGLPPFEVEAFRQVLADQHWSSTPLYPNIKGRLVSKNGEAFAPQLVQQNNALRRELNLTQAEQYPKDNVIVAGRSQLQQVGEVSVEAKLAEQLNIGIGDRLGFELPEGPLTAKVVNLRRVEWESFSPNFFFIFSPNTMDANAGSYLGSFYVPPEHKSQLVAVIQQFSNTVFVDVSLILNEVKNLVRVLTNIMSILAILVGLSGILVLMACINLMMDERKKEVALWRTFGSSKVQLKRMLMIELGFMGLWAGVVSCLFAELISAVACHQMGLEIQMHIEVWLSLPLLMLLICALIGRYRLSYLAELPPLQSLRSLN